MYITGNFSAIFIVNAFMCTNILAGSSFNKWTDDILLGQRHNRSRGCSTNRAASCKSIFGIPSLYYWHYCHNNNNKRYINVVNDVKENILIPLMFYKTWVKLLSSSTSSNQTAIKVIIVIWKWTHELQTWIYWVLVFNTKKTGSFNLTKCI